MKWACKSSCLSSKHVITNLEVIENYVILVKMEYETRRIKKNSVVVVNVSSSSAQFLGSCRKFSKGASSVNTAGVTCLRQCAEIFFVVCIGL